MTDTLARPDTLVGPGNSQPSYELVEALGYADSILKNDMFVIGCENDGIKSFADCQRIIGDYVEVISRLPLDRNTVRQIAIDSATIGHFLDIHDGLIDEDEITELTEDVITSFEDEITDRIRRYSGMDPDDEIKAMDNDEVSRKLIVAVLSLGSTPFSRLAMDLDSTDIGRIVEAKRTTYRSAA